MPLSGKRGTACQEADICRRCAPVPGSSLDKAYGTHHSGATSDGAFHVEGSLDEAAIKRRVPGTPLVSARVTW